MIPVRSATTRRAALAAVLFTLVACENSVTEPEPPFVESVAVSLPSSTITTGETTFATAAGVDQNSEPIALEEVLWSSSAESIATVNEAGLVTGVAAGEARIIATSNGVAGERTITVTAPPGIVINEIESNGGTPGDWVELYNPTGGPVDVSGWVFKDNDDSHAYVLPAGSIILSGGYLVLDEAAFGFGLGTPDAARLFNAFGAPVDSHAWTPHAPTTYGRCPSGAGDFVTTSAPTKGAPNNCAPDAASIVINEVESSGGTPGDWVELYNTSPNPVNLAGFTFRDDNDAAGYVLPAGTTIAGNGYLVLEEAAFGFGLGAADAARLFDASGALIDSYAWTSHATTTYGRCPSGTGGFTTTTTPTKGAANACPGEVTVLSWPGDAAVQVVDGLNVFGGNLSGLTYEGANGAAPTVLWAARNGPGSIFRLIRDGATWVPDPTNGWGSGKALRYPDGSGDPDAEGLTFAAASAGGIYVATERNNAASGVSRNSVLRFDPAHADATLTATHEWNLTADLPAVGPNLGIEAITWVPDDFLVTGGFHDESRGSTYNPANYTDHAGGLFFVGIEANGTIYAFALNHSGGGFTRVATIDSGFPGVMGVEFDRELGYLWALCDDGCGGRSNVLEIDSDVDVATSGRFVITHRFDRPAGMPNLNNEGFAIAPGSECVGGRKPVFWADDSETDGHSIRRGTIPCVRF